MEKIKYELSGGYTDWQAMLPIEFEKKYNLVSLLEEALWDGRPWDYDQTIPFILVGGRTLDPSTEEVEEMGYEGFAKKYPNGKPLHQPSANSEEFRDILNWGSIFATEHQVTDNPANGGGGIYRIISTKIKKVLEQFNLPPHRFYPAEVTHEITGEKRPYYLFHLTHEKGDYLDTAYWPKMEASIIKKGEFNTKTNIWSKDETVKKFDKGSFSDVSDYRNKAHQFKRTHAGIAIEGKINFQTKEGKEAKKKLRGYLTEHPYYVYKESHDIIGMGTSMVISKNLKEALELAFPNEEWYDKRNEEGIKIVRDYQPGEELPF